MLLGMSLDLLGALRHVGDQILGDALDLEQAAPWVELDS
jgi:hypothetical protein